MNNKTAKQILTSYRIKLALLCCACVIAVGALAILAQYSFILGIAGIIVLGANVTKPFRKLAESELESIIFDELDPEKFNELIELGAFKRSKRLQVLCAVSLGEHEKALSLMESEKTGKEHPVEKCNNVYRKGYIHFERGEFDKLPAIVKEYNELKKNHPQFVVALNHFTVFDKFDAFADEDYEYVVDVCDIDLKEINPKAQNHKLTRINVGFYRAVSLYKMGKLDEAKLGFEEIIKFAPKMYKAKLSKEYIELIEKV